MTGHFAFITKSTEYNFGSFLFLFWVVMGACVGGANTRGNGKLRLPGARPEVITPSCSRTPRGQAKRSDSCNVPAFKYAHKVTMEDRVV